MKKSPSRAPKTPTMADSLRAAAGVLGTTHTVLRAAKEAGCPGFKSGRVDVALVKAWLAKHPIESSEPAMSPLQHQKFRKLKADADMKEHHLAVRRGEFLPRAEVRSLNTRAVATARSVMTGKASGLALVLGSMSGLDPVLIEERIKEANREIIAELHRAPLASNVWTCEHCGKESRIDK